MHYSFWTEIGNSAHSVKASMMMKLAGLDGLGFAISQAGSEKNNKKKSFSQYRVLLKGKGIDILF